MKPFLPPRPIFAALLLSWFSAQSPARAQSDDMIIADCTPDSVQIGHAPLVRTGNPIAYALERAGPGSRIYLKDGVYNGFSVGQSGASGWNARASGRRGQPISIEGQGRVRIRSKGGGDTIQIAQQIPCAYLTFRNLTIEAGYRSAVMFANGGVHEGFVFEDCHIQGTYNFVTGQGGPSKWGIHGYGLKDFVFRGARDRARVINIRDEHGFYLHNLKGDVLIEKVSATGLGRTFFQLTARDGEGPAGIGTVTLRDCIIRDVGLAAGDAHKGGSAITIGGRHKGTVIVERCEYKAGFDARLTHLTRPGEPYGTGAFVSVDTGQSEPNGVIVLRDNAFLFAPECGDRPVVSLGGAREVRIEGENRFFAGKYGVAIRVDPVWESSGELVSRPLGSLSIDPRTQLRGTLEVRDHVATPAERARFGLRD